jgi:hypothetical protein
MGVVVLFVGYTRFSIFTPGSGAWVASNNSRFKTEDEYRDYLFSDERLATRARIFTELSIPALAKASRGYDYYHVVTYNDFLPAKYREALEEAALRYPFLILDKIVDGVGTMNAHRLLRRLYEPGGRERGEAFGLFRLDDDDLLASNYFTQMAAYVRPDMVGFQVSLGRGVTALHSAGGFTNFREAYAPMNSMGLMSVGQVDDAGLLVLPADASHNRSDRTNPVVLDSRELSWLWVRHNTQDTTLTFGDEDRTLLEMSRHPELSPDVDVAGLFQLS